MHYHLEIIMPPTADVDAAVTEILHQFDENAEGEDVSKHSFWDFWKIGGRWGGAKLEAMLGADRLTAFRTTLTDHKLTVSGLVFGKETLQPAEQVELVDRLWNEAFPDSPVRQCPLFDNYKGTFGDVMSLKDCPKALECSRVIIAGPTYDGTRMEAVFMQERSIWNGVNYQMNMWDGTIATTLADNATRLEGYNPEYVAKYTPTDDWLVVTVDYHS